MKGKQGIKRRQKSALNLLESQLKRGTKPEKLEGKTIKKHIVLSDSDKKRINGEIQTLIKKIG